MGCSGVVCGGITSDESGNGVIVATDAAGGVTGQPVSTPLMVLPGYYYQRQYLQQQHAGAGGPNHQHQHSSSSSSSTATSGTTTATTLPPGHPHHPLHHPHHQHQHSNTTNTTTLTTPSSSPRGSQHSQHSSRSSGAHSSSNTAAAPPQLHGPLWGGVPPPPHTAPVTPASTAPRDSGLQQAIERVGAVWGGLGHTAGY